MLARTLPWSALAISDLIQPRCLLTRRALPSSRMVIFSSSSAARSLARLREPFGRPLGLPEWPFLKRVDSGGLAYPILSAILLRLGIGTATARRAWRRGFVRF